jgi:hypothetical protein
MFVELLLPAKPSVLPGDQQRKANLLFPELVSRSSMHLWKPGDPIDAAGRRLLVGVATYSPRDLELLDRLEEYLRVWSAERVDVFNIDDCKAQDDFCKYVPGLVKVLQTPVVGLWINGALSTSATGQPASDILADEFVGFKGQS